MVSLALGPSAKAEILKAPSLYMESQFILKHLLEGQQTVETLLRMEALAGTLF